MLTIIIEFILEGLAQLGLELVLWSMGVRWILFTFFAVATVICFLSRLYLASGISAVASIAFAAWPRKRDQAL